MEQITLRIPLRLKAELEREAAEHGVSRSEHMRNVLEQRADVDELRDRLEQREARIDSLEEQLRKRSHVEEKVDELALELKETRGSADAPFFVRWARWWRER